MSHTVRITRTTTETSNVLVLNTGYLKTTPGLLKIAEMILGIVAVVLIALHFDNQNLIRSSSLFFYLMAVTFLVCTSCLVLACVVSWSTGGLISKTMFELVYHSVATILLLVASVILLVNLHRYDYNHYRRLTYSPSYEQLLAAGIVGLVNAVFYLASAVHAQRSYRGI